MRLAPAWEGDRVWMEGSPTHLQLLFQAESLSEEHVLLSLQLLPLQLLPLGLLVRLRELAVKPVEEHGRRDSIRQGRNLGPQHPEAAGKRCHRCGWDTGRRGTQAA